MSSLVFPGLDVADAGPTPLRPAAAALTDPPALGGGFSSAGPGDDDSSESSSIGSPSSDDDDGDEDRGSDGHGETGSNSNKDGSTGSGSSSSSLGSLSSLEDSLPIKRGLSNHFAGKSRSFSNLSECAGANVGDLVKHENPFNKRRRIQIVNSISYKRRASCSSLITTLLPPLLSPEHALQEEEEEEEEDEDDENDEGNVRRSCFPTLHLAPHGARFYKEAKMKKAALKSPRSFPLFEDLRYV